MAPSSDTFSGQITKWMIPTLAAIKAEAIRLCSGPLLHIGTGTLVNSFYTKMWADGHMGQVWNTAPYFALWEFTGLGTKVKKAPEGHPFVIVKRGVFTSPRAQKGVIYRQTIKPKGKYAKPLAPLWTATKTAVRGPEGQKRREDLGYGIGLVIVFRYIRMLEQSGANVTVRVV